VHEVSLSRQLAAAVDRARHGRQVAAVHVEIGDLRQVVPDSLSYAWTFVVRGTPLEGARLEICRCPTVLSCVDCGVDVALGPEFGFACRACGSADTRLVSGEQFRLTAIDVNPAHPTRGDQHGPLPPP
jgi:hydrogenase nickel incorporation protein HypA/HybF